LLERLLLRSAAATKARIMHRGGLADCAVRRGFLEPTSLAERKFPSYPGSGETKAPNDS
jgi:hypothetical protein